MQGISIMKTIVIRMNSKPGGMLKLRGLNARGLQKVKPSEQIPILKHPNQKGGMLDKKFR